MLITVTINTALGWEGPPHERKRAVLTARTKNRHAERAGGNRKAARFTRRASYLHGATPQAGPRDPKVGPPCA